MDFQDIDVYVWVGVWALTTLIWVSWTVLQRMGVINCCSCCPAVCRAEDPGGRAESQPLAGARTVRTASGDVEMARTNPTRTDYTVEEEKRRGEAQRSHYYFGAAWICPTIEALAAIIISYFITVILFAIFVSVAGMSFAVVPIAASECEGVNGTACGPDSGLECCSYSMRGCV